MTAAVDLIKDRGPKIGEIRVVSSFLFAEYVLNLIVSFYQYLAFSSTPCLPFSDICYRLPSCPREAQAEVPRVNTEKLYESLGSSSMNADSNVLVLWQVATAFSQDLLVRYCS